jgi:predicted branched-subunit amino acid permease
MGLVMGRLLTDESYSISMANFLKTLNLRFTTFYYLGAAGPTYFGWQITGILGYLGGTFLPQILPFKMAIPMVFLTLLISVLKASPKRPKH